MKITDLFEMTSGSVASVAMPMGKMKSRTKVDGLEPVSKVMKGTAKKKGPYANSLSESTKQKTVSEAELSEQDLIMVPGLKRKSSELMSKDANEMERIEMALSDLKQSVKSARSIHAILKSSNDEIEGWVQEKLAKAEDYLNTVREYREGKVALEMRAGTIAGGVAFESTQKVDSIVTDALKVMKGPEVSDAVLALKRVLGDRAYNERRGFYNFYITQIHKMYNQSGVEEGAKVDRMVKHVKKSEKELGHSDKEAENIAWATANKRGMLDNKNKKK